MFGKLLPCGGGASIPLLKEKLLLGRKSDCDIPIACSTVSGHHCRLEFKDGSWWVRDLDSTNGTSLNGRRVSKQRIAPLDILTIGRQRLVVDYQATPLAAAKPSRLKSARRERRGQDDDLALAFLNHPTVDDEPDPMPLSEKVSPCEQVSMPEQVSLPQEPVNISLSKTPLPPPSPGESESSVRPMTELGRLIPAGGGVPIVLTSEELIVGRHRDCDIQIRIPSISSRHCKLMMKEGYWHVEDLNSTNGTWVNGDRCLFECLPPDSDLALDKHHFTLEYVPRSEGPPPIVRQLFTQSLLEKAGLGRELMGNNLAGEELPEDDSDRPKRYNLLDSNEELPVR